MIWLGVCVGGVFLFFRFVYTQTFTWCALSLRDLWFGICHKFWKVFCHFYFKYFCLILSSDGIPIMHMLHFSILSHSSQTFLFLLSFVFQFGRFFYSPVFKFFDPFFSCVEVYRAHQKHLSLLSLFKKFSFLLILIVFLFSFLCLHCHLFLIFIHLHF